MSEEFINVPLKALEQLEALLETGDNPVNRRAALYQVKSLRAGQYSGKPIIRERFSPGAPVTPGFIPLPVMKPEADNE